MGSSPALRDHRAVQLAAVRTTVAGLGAGLLHGVAPGAAVDALGGLGVGLAALPPSSVRDAAVTAALAAGAAGLGHALHGAAGALAAVGLGALAYATATGPRGAGRVVAALAGAGALAAAWFVIAALVGGGALDLMPPRLGWMLLGGAGGLLAGLGAAGRELALVETAPSLPAGPAPAVAALEDGEAGELGELAARARAAGDEVVRAVRGEIPEAAAAATALVEKIGRAAIRWREIERQLERADRPGLEARAAHLSERARTTGDDSVRDDYLRAERAVRQQLDDLDAIRAARERALARLHHHVAVLERLRLASLHHRSVAADGAAGELGPLVEEVSAAGLELDGATEALVSLPA